MCKANDSHPLSGNARKIDEMHNNTPVDRQKVLLCPPPLQSQSGPTLCS